MPAPRVHSTLPALPMPPQSNRKHFSIVPPDRIIVTTVQIPHSFI